MKKTIPIIPGYQDFSSLWFALVGGLVSVMPWISSYLVKLFAGFIFIIMCVHLIMRARSFLFSKIDGLMLMLLITMTVSTVRVSLEGALFSQIIDYIGIYFLFFVVGRFCNSRKNLFFLGNCYVIGCIFVSFFLIINFVQGDSVEGGAGRFSIGDMNANYAAYTLATAVVIIFSFYIASQRLLSANSFVSIAVLFLIVMAIMLTGCRGAMLAVIFSFILVFFRFLVVEKKYFLGFFLVVSALAFVAFLFSIAPIEIQERYTVFDTSDMDSLSAGRTIQFEIAKELISNNLVFGSGARAFFDGADENLQLHNVFLSVTLEHGLIGVVLYLLVVLMCVDKIIIFNAKSVVFWVASLLLLAWIPIAATGVWAYAAPAWFIFAWVKKFGELFHVAYKQNIEALT